MKKTIAIILVAVLCISNAYAEKEVTFLGIPWMSDEDTTIKMLKEGGYIRSGVSTPILSQENMSYLVKDESGFIAPAKITGLENVVFMESLKEMIKGKIAGYPIKDLMLTYVYDGEYRLIAARIELYQAEYIEIKEKLKTVYGEGEEKETEEGIISISWQGDNNSAVLLYTENDGYKYTLMYGRTDVLEIITKTVEKDPENVAGL